jgi:hypothetical protein
MKIYIVLLLSTVFTTQAFANCEHFESVLREMQNAKIEVGKGMLAVNGKKFPSCVVQASGNPNNVKGDYYHGQFAPTEGSYLYQKGWRLDQHSAADSGSGGSFGIFKPGVYCLIRSSWEDGSCCGNDTDVPPEKHWFKTTVECTNTSM